jgi:hypothetical protein
MMSVLEQQEASSKGGLEMLQFDLGYRDYLSAAVC